MKRLYGPAFALASFGAAGTALAQHYSDFRIRPSPAQAGQDVDLVVRAEWCDYLPPPQAVVQTTGSAVVVTAPDSDACFGVGGTAVGDLTIPLGAFEPGTYRMRFVGGLTQTQWADLPFVVGAAQATPMSVPVGGGAFALALGTLLAVFAGCGLRRRLE
ncbi:hypothetical protein [Dokdonella sp.]|uniref:hypothetical protein n=1 Tax=Dokdonella sp. TaxID=2291710 RepID=UPI002634753E|nr:hypothetical protein [Dokdonella sp.]